MKAPKTIHHPWFLAAQTTSEHAQQIALMAWVRRAARYGFKAASILTLWDDYEGTEAQRKADEERMPECHWHVLKWMHAIPNGGFRDKATANKLKNEGALSGVLDLFLPFAVANRHGLYVEMKNATGNPSNEQLEFISFVTQGNFAAYVAYSWTQAAAIIYQYLTSCSQKDADTVKKFLDDQTPSA